MMVTGFIVTYAYLAYTWWMNYSGSLYNIPTYRTVLGFGMLLIFGSRAVMTPPAVVSLGVISAAFHLNKDQWNPFHSGYTASAITVLGVLGSVALMGLEPFQWIQNPSHAAGTSFLAVAAMSTATAATIRTQNPLRYITVLSGLYKEPGGIQPSAYTSSPETSEQQAPNNPPADKSSVSDVDVEDLAPAHEVVE